MEILETNTEFFIELENNFGAHNYNPLPVVLSKGEGVKVWDVEGKKYFDFLSAYSAVNQGHCNQRIINTLIDQAQRLTLTSRAFYNNQLGLFEKKICNIFGYDKVIPMNTGAEAVETAIKICRKWAYEKKGILTNTAKIIVCDNNFHGRTSTIVSFSSDNNASLNFGPYDNGFIKIPYNNTEALKEILESEKNIAGFLVEPIQGEAGVFVPDDGYLSKCFELCNQHNVLFIADEIQTGIARTGRMLAIDYEHIKADMLILGKALSGGVYPVSVVLADNKIMEVIKPGQHGSTFGGNPLGVSVSMTALDVVIDDKLAENALKMGEIFRKSLTKYANSNSIIKSIRGKGLLNAIEINDKPDSLTAWNICLKLKDNGLLAKPTHGNIIRFAPPLIITDNEMLECIDIITKTLNNF